MEEVTCPNCNADTSAEDLKRNGLCCPTCGFDMSEVGGDDLVDPDDEEEAH